MLTMRLRNQRGIALPVAIFLLVIVGALVAGAIFVATQHQRSAENTRRVGKSFELAEEGAFAQVRNWQSAWDNLTVYGSGGTPTAAISKTPVAGVGTYSGKVFRLSNSTYLVDITAGDTLATNGSGARQRVGLLLRQIPSTPVLDAAITTRGGSGDFRGGYKVSGVDSIPHGWGGCPPLTASIPGFVTNDTASFVGKKTPNIAGAGTPPWKQDGTLTPASMDTVGNTNLTYDNLVARANITLPAGYYVPGPVSAGGVCTTAVTTNWGDTLPTNPCGSYFPIVHITGNLSVHSGFGQGILLIDGDATLTNFTWVGMVMIKGALAPQTDSTHFFRVTGGLQVKNQNNATQDVWDINAKYSSCALGKVFAQVPGGMSPLRSRSWAELY